MKGASLAVALLIAASAACGGSSSHGIVKVASNGKLKKSIVVDAHGQTAYMFLNDTKGHATCVGDSPAPGCGKIWPPVVAKGKLAGGTGIDASLLGTTKRSDGVTQVTYNGYPLYYFRGYSTTPADKKPGDVNGQGFYTVWFVLSPQGHPIRSSP